MNTITRILAPVPGWPQQPEELIRLQRHLAAEADRADPYRPPPEGPRSVGGVFVAFPTGVPPGPGAAGERAWAAAVVMRGARLLASAVVEGQAPAAYEAGLLALRAGPLLEAAVAALPWRPEVLLVNATGRDHPRGAGLALHLGAVLGLPTVGVTDRPLVSASAAPGPQRGDAAPLQDPCGRLVGYAVRTRTGARPVIVHAAWRTDADCALRVVLAAGGRHRTPEPLRAARRAARARRARDEGRAPDRTG